MNAQNTPRCILIADDMTGACDTGVQFVRQGLDCHVQFEFAWPTTPWPDVVAFNTNSRCNSVAESQRKLQQVARCCATAESSLMFKKIDSTLRGNVAAEITAAMSLFGCELALVAPSIPALGRVVRNGVLEWKDFAGAGRMEVARLLEEQGINGDHIGSLASGGRDSQKLAEDLNAQIANGKTLIVADCEIQDDLRLAIVAGMKIGRRILWVGAAGLGVALAEYMGSGVLREVSRPEQEGPLVFCIGSTHAVTIRQQKRLMKSGDALQVVAAHQNIKTAHDALRDGRHLVVVIERDRSTVNSLRDFFDCLSGLTLAGIFLSGGDTAMLICKVFEVQSIHLRGEITMGLPWGTLHSGAQHDLPVATKAGGFGSEDALLQCVEFFAAAKAGR